MGLRQDKKLKHYYFGAQRVAVRDGSGTGTTGLSWLLTDHLGSTTVTLDASLWDCVN